MFVVVVVVLKRFW